MTKLTKLEVGKTYVFKDEGSKQAYIDLHSSNENLISKYYTGGFTICMVDEDGDGKVNGCTAWAIVSEEVKFFKLKEENVVTNKFDKSMLKDGMVVMLRNQNCPSSKGRLLVLNETIVDKEGYLSFSDYTNDLLSEDGDVNFDMIQVFSVDNLVNMDINDWTLTPVWKREEKSPTQLKIEEMESSVAELQKQINELKQM